jgi:hypothetical protein
MGSASKDIVATMTGSGGETSDDPTASSSSHSSTSWFNICITAGSVLLGVFAVVYLGRVIKVAIAKAEAAERRREAASIAAGLDGRGEEVEEYQDGMYGAGEDVGVQLSHTERIPLLAGGVSGTGVNSSANFSSGLGQVMASSSQTAAAGNDILVGFEEERRHQ